MKQTHICLGLQKWDKNMFIWRMWLNLSSAQSPKHTHAFTLSSLFSLHYLLFHCLFFLPLPVQAVCVNGTVVLCGGPTPGTAVSHKSASSFNRYRQGLSVCVSESVPLTVSLFFYLFSPSQYLNPHSSQPSFSGLRSFFFFLSECSALLVSFSVLGSQDYTWRGQYNPLSTLFTANPVQYYRFIHLHPLSCFKIIFSDMRW